MAQISYGYALPLEKMRICENAMFHSVFYRSPLYLYIYSWQVLLKGKLKAANLEPQRTLAWKEGGQNVMRIRPRGMLQPSSYYLKQYVC